VIQPKLGADRQQAGAKQPEPTAVENYQTVYRKKLEQAALDQQLATLSKTLKMLEANVERLTREAAGKAGGSSKLPELPELNKERNREAVVQARAALAKANRALEEAIEPKPKTWSTSRLPKKPSLDDWATGADPNRRLDQLEMKVDQILKALEGQAAGKQ
jgi:hypothetical protein